MVLKVSLNLLTLNGLPRQTAADDIKLTLVPVVLLTIKLG